MNMEDVIDLEYGLQQDEWSLSRPKFGENRQLEVIGWSGRQSGQKLYILTCSKCAQDNLLFGEGFFKSQKGSLIVGTIPCGCSKSIRWSREQYSVICQRKAADIGSKFLDFVGEWKNRDTKVKMSCYIHGEWFSGNINSIINNKGCPKCAYDQRAIVASETHTKPDEDMISSFLASGAFHPETKFCRIDRKDSRECKPYWSVFCPECKDSGESTSSDLQKGHRPCSCSRMRQKEAYINLIIDNSNVIIPAVKFGVAVNSRARAKRQNSKSIYEIQHHARYRFTDVYSCKKAERECLQELECGVISRHDMPDGYTETTWPFNLDKIIEIYERNGGIKIENTD